MKIRIMGTKSECEAGIVEKESKNAADREKSETEPHPCSERQKRESGIV